VKSTGDQLKIFSGNANPDLAREICRHLRQPLGQARVVRFPDGEIWVKIAENVRGADVFVVQPTFAPADNLMELLILCDALLRASARRITAVIPYFGYARQERKSEPRVPISAKLVANLISSAGVNRVLTMDLHSEVITGFFDLPVDHLFAAPVIIGHFRKKRLRDFVVVAADTGGVVRARAFAKRLGDLPLVVIDKRRPEPTQAEVMNVIGDVRGRKAVVVEDIIDTATTITKVAEALKAHGAKDIYVSCTHPILSGEAVRKLEASPIKEVVVTNTVPLPPEKRRKKITVLSVAGLFGEAVQRIHEERSVSSLFI